MANFIKALFPVLLLANLSCKKEFTQESKNDLLSDAVSYFEKNGKTNLKESIIPTRSPKRQPDWSKGFVHQQEGAEVVIAPLVYDNNFLIKSNLDSNLYSINNISYILMIPEKSGQFQIKSLLILPLGNNAERKFNGIIACSDWHSDSFEYAYKYSKSSRKLSTSEKQISLRTEATIKVEHYIEGHNYSSEDPDGYAWREYIGTSYYSVPDNFGISSGSFAGQARDYLNTSSVQDIVTSISPTNFIVDPGERVITNISAYTKCFNKSPQSKYEVTIYVRQPSPGTRATWVQLNTPVAAKVKSPVFVGHTFISLKQESQEKTIVRNVGYYPAKSVTPVSPITSGVKHNDENRGYNISLTISITYEQFSKIIDYINSEVQYYNLNTFNCTTFALDALLKADINLPRTTGKWINGSGLNPGDLGEDIRSMSLTDGMSRSTKDSNHNNEGACQ